MWRKRSLPCTAGTNTNWRAMENSMEVPHKVKNRITIWSDNSTIGYLPKEMKTWIQKDTCTPPFNAALFTIAKIWKQPTCPSTGEWIKKIWHTFTMEYYLVRKKNEILPFVTTWMELENIMLSEISQRKKNTTWFHLEWNPRNKTKKKETNRLKYRELVVSKGVVGGGRGEIKGMKKTLILMSTE